MKAILIILYICGQPDTIIWKYPDKTPQFSTKLSNPAIQLKILNVLEGDPIVIRHKDKRGVCT